MAVVFRGLDVLSIMIGAVLVSYLYHLFIYGSVERVMEYAFLGVIVALFFVTLNELSNAYEVDEIVDVGPNTCRVLFNWFASWVILGVIAFLLKSANEYSRVVVVALVVGGAFVHVVTRSIAASWVARALRRGQLARRRVAALVFDGDGAIERSLTPHFSIVAARSVDSNATAEVISAVAAEFAEQIKGSRARRLFICVSAARLGTIKPVIARMRALSIPVDVVTEPWLSDVFREPAALGRSLVSFEVSRPPMSWSRRIMKRSLDLVVSSVALVVLSPWLLIVAAAVKLDSQGPVLFSQRRLGFNGREFRIYKFRSMTVMEDGTSVVQARKQDQRVTRVGRFIRATSLDELPQLINVLRGDMSLVGPRPHALAHDQYYETVIADYSRRREVKPGLTGWAQVNGYRGETPTLDLMERRVEHDLWYVSHASVTLDIWIMIRTAFELVRNRNVY